MMKIGDRVCLDGYESFSAGTIRSVNGSFGLAVVEFDIQSASGVRLGAWPLSTLSLIEIDAELPRQAQEEAV